MAIVFEISSRQIWQCGGIEVMECVNGLDGGRMGAGFMEGVIYSNWS